MVSRLRELIGVTGRYISLTDSLNVGITTESSESESQRLGRPSFSPVPCKTRRGAVSVAFELTLLPGESGARSSVSHRALGPSLRRPCHRIDSSCQPWPRGLSAPLILRVVLPEPDLHGPWDLRKSTVRTLHRSRGRGLRALSDLGNQMRAGSAAIVRALGNFHIFSEFFRSADTTLDGKPSPPEMAPVPKVEQE